MTAPPRAPGELADELEDARAQVLEIKDYTGLDDDALDRALDSFAHVCLDLMPDILAALRAPQGDGAEAMRLLVQVSLIQARELKRLAPDDTIPADLVEAMESLRAALDQHSLTKNQGGGDA